VAYDGEVVVVGLWQASSKVDGVGAALEELRDLCVGSYHADALTASDTSAHPRGQKTIQ
jgi:hypothetical protein